MFRKNDEFRIDIIETKSCTYFKFLQPIHNTFLQISGKKDNSTFEIEITRIPNTKADYEQAFK